jgi:hypothetical protein
VARNRDAIEITEGAVAKKVSNSVEEAKKSVILYRVSLRFDLDNFADVLGEDLASYRRFTKKGSAEETETLELKFYIADDASKHIRASRIMVGNHAFRTAPKMIAPLKICRVYKTIDLKHRPQHEAACKGKSEEIQKNKVRHQDPRCPPSWTCFEHSAAPVLLNDSTQQDSSSLPHHSIPERTRIDSRQRRRPDGVNGSTPFGPGLSPRDASTGFFRIQSPIHLSGWILHDRVYKLKPETRDPVASRRSS